MIRGIYKFFPPKISLLQILYFDEKKTNIFNKVVCLAYSSSDKVIGWN